MVNESLPIFLDAVLGGGVRAVVVSTTMIVIFGEVIPQAVSYSFRIAEYHRAERIGLCSIRSFDWSGVRPTGLGLYDLFRSHRLAYCQTARLRLGFR